MKKTAITAFVCIMALSLFGCSAAPGGHTPADARRNADGAVRYERTSRQTDAHGIYVRTGREDERKSPVSGEPSYIRLYSPLSPMPLEWYGKYRIITDFQAF